MLFPLNASYIVSKSYLNIVKVIWNKRKTNLRKEKKKRKKIQKKYKNKEKNGDSRAWRGYGLELMGAIGW